MEIWKDIEGYDGDYQISNFGRVKSLDRYVNHISSVNGRLVKGQILKNITNTKGYLMVNLNKLNKSKTYKIHQLVWDYFGNGKRDGQKIQVDHILEGDKTNNRIDNLQLLTQRGNTTKYQKTQHTTSKYIGVCWNKKSSKWYSSICINGKQKYIGYFNNEYDAHLAYKKEINKSWINHISKY